jgi:hypothetical protein
MGTPVIRESLAGEMTNGDVQALADRLLRHSEASLLPPQMRTDMQLAASRLRLEIGLSSAPNPDVEKKLTAMLAAGGPLWPGRDPVRET